MHKTTQILRVVLTLTEFRRKLLEEDIYHDIRKFCFDFDVS